MFSGSLPLKTVFDNKPKQCLKFATIAFRVKYKARIKSKKPGVV